MYFAKPGTNHAIDNYEGLHLLEIKFYAYGALANALQMLPDCFSVSEKAEARMLYARAVSEGLRKETFYNGAADATLLLFLIDMLRTFQPHDAETNMHREFAMLDTVKDAAEDADILLLNLRSYIEAHIGEEITLEMLAEKVHLNRTYFVKRFKQLWGASPMKYVGNMRLERARELLLFSQDAISDIARRTGFQTVHYFSRKFKETYGISPNQYRTQQKRF